jgi:hypothetical protein
MATYVINDDFDVTVSQQGRSKSGFTAVGTIHARKTQKPVGKPVQGTGRTLTAAMNRAVAEARRQCVGLIPPDDDESN